MEFDATSDDRLELREIPSLFSRLLREIPTAAGLDSPKVTERFFPRPSEEPDEEGLCADWKEFVEPGLHTAFSEARQVVEGDLRNMVEEDGISALTISREHVLAWIHALNQARLALAAHHNLNLEEEVGSWPPEVIATEGDWLRLQMGFYDHILVWLIDLVEG